MIEKEATTSLTLSRATADQLTAPALFLSSENLNWPGLVAQGFLEPTRLEGWQENNARDIRLVMVMQGAMHVEQRPLGGGWKGVTLRQADLILSPGGGKPAELRWQGLSAEPIQTLHLQISLDLIRQMALELLKDKPQALGISRRAVFQDPLLAQIALSLWQELLEPSGAGKLYAQSAAQFIAAHLLRHYNRASSPIALRPAHKLSQKQLDRVMEFLQAHLSQDFSLTDLAEQAGFSPYHFGRLFRQTTGESPHQFVLRQRIKQAQKLLKETELTFSQIALEVGFANQSHFGRAFKRQLGLTPLQYRRSL